MKKRSRRVGRPKKQKGRIAFWRFARAGMVIAAYDEARERGEKHSVAIIQAVEYIRERYPKMPISGTEVRHLLASFRPKNSRTILQFKRSTLDVENLNRLLSMKEQVSGVQSNKGPSVSSSSIQNLPESRTSYKFGFAERPLYPRHNRKIPKE